MAIDGIEVGRWLARGWIAAEGAGLRDEDRKKAGELPGLLAELGRAIDKISKSHDPLRIVDAAAGKAYAGLLAGPLVLAPRARSATIIAIERAAERARAITEAAARLEVTIEVVTADVAEASLFEGADVVVALHACGAASDHVITGATEARARFVLVAPCCVAADLPASHRAAARADALGLPRAALVRRPFVESLVMAERALALEAAGYKTEVVAFAPSRVTPHGALLRAERVGEPGRMADAQDKLRALQEE